MLRAQNVLAMTVSTDLSPRGWVELDPQSEEIVWEYTGTPKRSFFASFISGAQLLPNENILVCEGAGGGDASSPRLFEVARSKEIVWEYRSPYVDPGTYGIYRAVRYAPEFVAPLLKGKELLG